MARIISIFVCMVILSGCMMYMPSNFSNHYTPEDTGLSERININGYYISHRNCDTAFYSIYMFYSSGLFTIATTSDVSASLVKCFSDGGSSHLCSYPLWGAYKVVGDTIKTQSYLDMGDGCIIFRDYLIHPDRTISNISDYVEPQHTNLGYMVDYPSYYESSCNERATFYPLSSRRDSTDCKLFKKRNFYLKKANNE